VLKLVPQEGLKLAVRVLQEGLTLVKLVRVPLES